MLYQGNEQMVTPSDSCQVGSPIAAKAPRLLALTFLVIDLKRENGRG